MPQPESAATVLADTFYTSGGEAVRCGEVFKVEAIKAGDAAAGAKPDKFIGILYDCINLGGTQPLLGAVLFKIECLAV